MLKISSSVKSDPRKEIKQCFPLKRPTSGTADSWWNETHLSKSPKLWMFPLKIPDWNFPQVSNTFGENYLVKTFERKFLLLFIAQYLWLLSACSKWWNWCLHFVLMLAYSASPYSKLTKAITITCRTFNISSWRFERNWSFCDYVFTSAELAHSDLLTYKWTCLSCIAINKR